MPDEIPTLGGLLFDSPNPAAIRPLLEKPALSDLRVRIENLPGITWPTAAETFADSLNAALDVSLVDVLRHTWGKLSEIHDALNGAHGETTFVPLIDHEIRSVHHPKIELLVQEKVLFSVTFDTELTIELEGVTLKIRDGRVEEIVSCLVAGHASLQFAGTTLVEKHTPKLSLASVKLHEPVERATGRDVGATSPPPQSVISEPREIVGRKAAQRGIHTFGAVVLGLVFALATSVGLAYVMETGVMSRFDNLRATILLLLLVYGLIIPLRYSSKRGRANAYIRPFYFIVFVWVVAVFMVLLPDAEGYLSRPTNFSRDLKDIIEISSKRPDKIFQEVLRYWVLFVSTGVSCFLLCYFLNRSLRSRRR